MATGVLAGVLGLTAVAMVAWAMPAFFDPCHSFGAPTHGTTAVGADDPCQEQSATSETKGQESGRWVLIQGATTFGCALALVAASRRQPTSLFAAAGLRSRRVRHHGSQAQPR